MTKKTAYLEIILLVFLTCIFLIFWKYITTTNTKAVESKKQVAPAIDQQAQQQLLEILSYKRTLSSEDRDVKQKIISSLPPGKQSGIVYQAADFTIYYVQKLDLFQVEITTENIPMAKEVANSWFLEQGLSQEGVCGLPVQYYVSKQVMSLTQGQKTTFSPIGPEC